MSTERPDFNEAASDLRRALRDALVPPLDRIIGWLNRGMVRGCGTCARCYPENPGMTLCETCGNKRCPHASDCRNRCTGSNEPGQVASR